MSTADLIHGSPDARYHHVEAALGKSVDPSSDVDVACFMTVDVVDADNEVMLPGGADFSRFEKNPVLLLCHAYGQPGSYYPLPVGKAIWWKSRPHGILAGLRAARNTAMGKEIKALWDEDMHRSFSIGFAPIESSPMTREEADSRADWAEAFKRTRGNIRVHRKWLLLELSAVPVPSCPEALITTSKSKGIAIPGWLNFPTNKGSKAVPEVQSSATTPDPTDGVMVAFYPDSGTAQRLAVDGGEAPDEIHLTLAYLGKASAVGTNTLERLKRILGDISCWCAPLSGSVSGMGRFSASDTSDGKDVVYAGADIPALVDFRQRLVWALSCNGIDYSRTHGYTPHMTLAYVDPGADSPVDRIEAMPLVFDCLYLVVSGVKQEFRLTAPTDGAPACYPIGFRSLKDGTIVGTKSFDGSLKPGMHVKHTKSGVCGVIKSLHSDGHVPDADTDLREDKEAPAALVDLHAKGCKPTGKTAAYACKDMGPIEPEPADETEKRLAQAILKRIVHHGDKWTVVSEDGSRTMGTYGTEAEAVERLRQVEGHKLHVEGKGLPVEVGHHVVIHKAMGGGCGVVKSLHTHGTVPGVVGEHPVHASEETPAARVEMHDHKCMGIGVHKAFHCKHLLPIVDGELNDQPGVIERPDADGPLAKAMVPYKSHPESTAAWDAGKARQQFKDRATTKDADREGETVDYDKYGEGFACSTGDGEKLGDFRYPHHYVEDGNIVTVRQGVASGIAACHGARSGATPEGAADAMQHLMKHAKELELPIAEDGKSLDWEELAAGTGWTRKSLMKGMAESSGTAGGYTTKPGTDADPDLQGPDVDDLTGLDDDDEDETPIRKGDPVHWDHHKGVPAGLGRVKSIHTTGRVPGAANEAEASDEEPHARIERYKDMGHPLHFHASGEHVAIPVTKCRKMLTMEVHPAVKGYGEQLVAWHRIADKDHLVTLHDLPAATKGVVPFREGTVVDAPWDASRAASRVKGFAAENLARALKCYAWFDERKANDQGCWWGLHHDIEVATGRLVVNREACRKLLATLDSAELPASDKAAIREHLEKHLASAGITEPAPVAPVLPVVKTAAEWETELLKHLAATGAAPPSPESQIADIVAGVEKRLYGAID